VPVKIRGFAHKGLKRLYSEDSAKGVPPDTVDKLRKIFAFLDNMEDAEELGARYLEGSYLDGRPQRHVEFKRHAESPPDVPYRHRRGRNLRCEFRGLPLGSEQLTCP
jgi:hypothetical protein